MACEVPVVASRVGGLPEVIDDGVTGFLHPPDDLDGMAASGVALLTDTALHARVAAAARRSVLERVLPRHCRAAVRSLLRACHQPVVDVLRATCYVLRATWYVRRATCYVLRATCDVEVKGATGGGITIPCLTHGEPIRFVRFGNDAEQAVAVREKRCAGQRRGAPSSMAARRVLGR